VAAVHAWWPLCTWLPVWLKSKKRTENSFFYKPVLPLPWAVTIVRRVRVGGWDMQRWVTRLQQNPKP